ncbi:nuclear transport factor 2 family protein [Pedobacter deserti]|uniref:nuclear transport factor 2 family protein n=1 Tax=Pedobacter deserti TaxID=2817382 RepID=UPI00210E1FA9|nr:nuclear transport factor 2 family protein [Pedobacter sp. SYSU D00382]
MATTRELIEEINALFVNNEMEKFMDYMADDCVWDMYSSSNGHRTFRSKAELAGMEDSSMPTVMNFKFGQITIEGNVAAVEGTADGTKADGSPYQSGFCDVYHFSNDKIVRITSYVVEY